MTMLQSFDHTLSWASVGDDGSVAKLGVPRSAVLTARRAPSNGWFSERTGQLLAFGWWNGGLNVWIGPDRRSVPGTDATLRDAGGRMELTLRTEGEPDLSHEFAASPASAISKIDPTSDETAEDTHFPTWLASTLSKPARITHLEAEFSRATEGADEDTP